MTESEKNKIWIIYRSILKNDTQSKKVQPEDTILGDFSAEVKKASVLLSFVLTEGHPCYIPDNVIEDIEDARESLKTSGTLTKEQRVKLLKAYRDLVTIPRASITFDGMPPTPFWNLHSRWLWLALIFTVTPLIIFLLFLFFKGFHFSMDELVIVTHQLLAFARKASVFSNNMGNYGRVYILAFVCLYGASNK